MIDTTTLREQIAELDRQKLGRFGWHDKVAELEKTWRQWLFAEYGASYSPAQCLIIYRKARQEVTDLEYERGSGYRKIESAFRQLILMMDQVNRTP